MSRLRALWLRFTIRSLNLEIDELEGHARHFGEMAQHKRNLRALKLQELDNLVMDRP